MHQEFNTGHTVFVLNENGSTEESLVTLRELLRSGRTGVQSWVSARLDGDVRELRIFGERMKIVVPGVMAGPGTPGINAAAMLAEVDNVHTAEFYEIRIRANAWDARLEFALS